MNRCFFYLLFLICVCQLTAQEKANFVFDHLTPASGFPANTSRSVVKNTDGSLWMLTEKGLMRYNGHSGKFYPPSKDSTGLLPHPLFKLYADKHGILWISYLEACISSFDPKTEKFTHYYHDPDDKTSFLNGGANQFMEDSKGNLWIAVWGGGLAKLNRTNGKFINYTPKEGDSTSINTDNITSVCELKNGKFLVGAWESGKFGRYAFLQYFDPQTQKFSRFNLQDYTAPTPDEKEKMKYVLKIIHFIYEQDEENVWVGSFIGLVHINLRNKTIERVTGTPGSKEKHESQRGYENSVDYVPDGDNLWVATEVSGIMIVDLKTKKCSYLNYEFSNSTALSSDNIISLYRDDDGNIWVSTRGAAADIYSPVLQQFRFTTNEKLKAEKGNRQQGATSLNYILTSRNSPHVFLPHGNGLTIYAPSRDTLICYDNKQLKKMFSPADLKNFEGDRVNVLSVKETEKHTLLFANYRLIKLSSDFKKLSLPLGKRPVNMVAASSFTGEVVVLSQNNESGFHETAKNRFVFVKLDKNTLKAEDEIPIIFPAFKGYEYVEATLMEALDEENWFISCNRIQFGVLNVKTKKFTSYSSRAPLSNFPDSAFGYLTADADKMVWLKASGGLYRFDYRTGKAELMNEKIGIKKNEQVMSVTGDLNGELWIALKQDLIRYTKKTGEAFRLSSKLGLKVGAFSPVTTHINTSDTIYIATNYGLLHFDPAKLVFEKKMNTLFLSSVVINKDTLSEGELSNFMSDNPILDWNQNFISFEFASHQYYTPGPKKYQYRLLGLDTVWYNNENRNYVSYTNLSPGSYTLEVICTNVFENISKKLVVPFSIDKPFWKKWWFITIEILAALLFIRAFIKYREKKLNKQKEQLEKTVKERTQEVVEKAREIELQNEIIQEKNKEMTDSIRYAQRIQNTLLAHEDFIKKHLPEHFIFFKPKDIVSGDFYWAAFVETTASNGHLSVETATANSGSNLFFLAICDCTGHGVPGAFMSMMNISFLNEAISEKGIYAPNEVFNYVRERLISNLSADGSKDGMDGTLICFDKEKNTIRYASAYNRPLHITQQGALELPADKMPVGIGERTDSFNLFSVQPQKGDTIYFYTDGFADQFGGPKGKKFKYKALNELLKGIADRQPEDQKGILEITFENWRGELEQIDDVMVTGIKW